MSKPMGLKEFIKVSETPDEALNMQQRMKLARSLKKNKAKIAIGRKRAARKVASMDVLKKRAAKQARMTIMKKITKGCLLYTSPSPRDATLSRMPSSA